MSDTYRPNEIVKRKHLTDAVDELKTLLGLNRVARSFVRVDYVKVENGSTKYPTINLNEPVISLRTDYAAASPKFTVRCHTEFAGSAPIVTVNSENWYLSVVNYGYRNSGTTDTAWNFSVKNDNATIEAETFILSVDFIETPDYQSVHWDITVNVSEPT